MRFRPCIDIHNGRVKQIVGGSLRDEDTEVKENYVSPKGADFYASLYRDRGLRGGHIIILNKPGTPEYEASKAQALKALSVYPQGMQIGGGIAADNAYEYIEAGASHVIVTSYIFDGDRLEYDRLDGLVSAVGRERIVLDLSCRYKDDGYYVVTDRWQTFTDIRVCGETLKRLGGYCDEYLIHGVDVEGLRQGTDERLLTLLADGTEAIITYAGGVRGLSDIELIYRLGRGRLDYTIGSALDIFGGELGLNEVIEYNRKLCT